MVRGPQNPSRAPTASLRDRLRRPLTEPCSPLAELSCRLGRKKGAGGAGYGHGSPPGCGTPRGWESAAPAPSRPAAQHAAAGRRSRRKNPGQTGRACRTPRTARTFQAAADTIDALINPKLRADEVTDSENVENRNKSDNLGDILTLLWGGVGFIAGFALSLTYARSRGYDRDDTLPLIPEGIIAISLLFGPAFMMGWIADQLRQEVLSNKSTWATYWSTMFGIAVAALALAGITSFDEILKVLN